jgi:hypothetical protein
MAGASRIMQAIRIRDTTQPFDRLVRFNWPGQLLITFAGMLASFFIAGFWYPYWRVADMDFVLVYNALLLNAHLPQEYFDHPGYLPILLLSYWLRAVHSVGVIPVDSFSALPPASDVAAFGAVWMKATQAARVLSLIIAMGFVAAFFYLLRAFIRDWRIAGLGGFLLAFSGGMAMQTRTIRTELLAAALFTIALLMLLVVARRGERPWRPAIIGTASLLITLGMQSKVQVFFLICALPALLLPFGPEPLSHAEPRRGFWDTPRLAWPTLAATAAVTALAAYLARDILALGFADISHADAPLHPVGIGAAVYWTIVAVWLGLGMTAYWIVWRVAAPEALASMLAALAGCMIGLLALDLRYHPDNVIVVFHPLETMMTFGSASYPALAGGSTLLSAARIQFLLQALAGVIERRTFILQTSARPAIFLEWFVIAATIIAIRRRQWLLVAQVAVLMLTNWAMDTLGMGQHLQQAYFLFTDPLTIIAAALLIAQLSDLQLNRWTYPLGIALIAVTVVMSQAEPVKHLFRTAGPEVLCTPGLDNYYRRLHFPFCPPPAPRPQ